MSRSLPSPTLTTITMITTKRMIIWTITTSLLSLSAVSAAAPLPQLLLPRL